jgi:hypothetical protein
MNTAPQPVAAKPALDRNDLQLSPHQYDQFQKLIATPTNEWPESLTAYFLRKGAEFMSAVPELGAWNAITACAVADWIRGHLVQSERLRKQGIVIGLDGEIRPTPAETLESGA